MATIEWFEGDRDELQELFELADDSPPALAEYRDEGRVLVARDDERVIVGHLQLIGAEIKNVAVREERQGEGFGVLLVDRAIAHAREEGMPELVLSTATADTTLLRFYMRRGFRMQRIVRDVFTPANGYPEIAIDGVPMRDQVWLSLEL